MVLKIVRGDRGARSLPLRDGTEPVWHVVGIMASVLVEILLRRYPGIWWTTSETSPFWAARIGQINSSLALLWLAAGLWGVLLSGSRRGGDIFAGGLATLLSRWLFMKGLPVFYSVLGRYYPGAAGVLNGNHWATVLLNVLGVFIAAGYTAACVQGWLWKTAGWETRAEQPRPSMQVQAAGIPPGANVSPVYPQAPRQTSTQAGQVQQFSLPGVSYYPRKEPDPSALDRVIGLEEAKIKVMRAMNSALDEIGVYAEYGLSPPGGILLYGPPGTGKTSFARACADAFGCAFYVVNASAIVGSLVGQSEKAVSSLFQHARANRPAVIFWDEIDAVARRRDGASLNRPSDLVLNVLLAEMDGFQSKGEKGVLVIGATNRLDVLDPAILRPGRFDEKIEVGLPDAQTRVVMLEFFLKGRKAAGISREVLEEIAAATEGWSPAELKALVDEAAWTAVEAGRPITPAFLSWALQKAARDRPEALI